MGINSLQLVVWLHTNKRLAIIFNNILPVLIRHLDKLVDINLPYIYNKGAVLVSNPLPGEVYSKTKQKQVGIINKRLWTNLLTI